MRWRSTLRDIIVQTDEGGEIYLGTDIELSHEGFTPPPMSEEVGTGYVMPQNTITFNVTFDPEALSRLEEWMAQESRVQESERTLRQVYEEYLGSWRAARVEYRGTARQMGRTRETREVPDPPAWIDEAAGNGYFRVRRQDTEQQIWHEDFGNPYKNPAVEKAEELLLLCLKEHQVETYQERGFFDVTGSAGGRYRIHNWYRSYNVIDLFSRDPDEHGAYYDTYCAMPMQGNRGFPIGDQLLAQKLMIETDEKGFLDTANYADDLFNEIERFGCIPQEAALK